MNARNAARDARNAIAGCNPWTMFQLMDGALYISAPGGLTPTQKEIAAAHKAELIELLSTPPDQAGECIRGHEIAWTLNQYGEWVCKCYYDQDADSAARAVLTGTPKPSSNSYRNYWMKNTTEGK